MSEIHSTGRGGAGNIGKDPVAYTDGEVVREGVAGKSAAPDEYSTGRGGAGNIGGEQSAADQQKGRRTDVDVIPESAMTEKHQGVYHTGRGGEGNVHKDKYGGHSKPQSAEHMAKYHGGEGETAEEHGKKSGHGAGKAEHSVGEKLKHLFDKN